MKIKEVFISNAAIHDRAACQRFGDPRGVVRAILGTFKDKNALHVYEGHEPWEAPDESPKEP